MSWQCIASFCSAVYCVSLMCISAVKRRFAVCYEEECAGYSKYCEYCDYCIVILHSSGFEVPHIKSSHCASVQDILTFCINQHFMLD